MQRSRKNLLITLAAAAILLLLISGSNAGSFRRRYSTTVREKLPWTLGQSIDIAELGGDINIIGIECNQKKISSGSVADSEKYCSTIQVKGIQTCFSPDLSAARDHVGDIVADTDRRGGVFKIRTILPTNWEPSMAGKVDYILNSPASAPLTLQTVTGDISITGMKSPITATTANGDINIEYATSSLNLKTVTGDINLNGSPASATLNTVTGALTIKIYTLTGVNIDIDTITGPVRIEVPKDFDATVTATSAAGRIETDKSDLLNGKTQGGSYTAGTPDSKNKITIHTFTGNITITVPDSGDNRDNRKNKLKED